ncbi:NAD-dependent epimerase/dehydratase [Magnetococcus marinus MC-1]|uniref:NAD-dependent epimerase/dehydratase n=1 Tax=Magnetococcus marinus (strain ATCC BAA-1437 / JCM 17883 / MC-1) TaxID=156889 RepID=A0L9M4_MAGMM|nr:NAD-dependent epimerase/dehydratase family protein [Magnetococcus marinus]ABK44667.1 NAD-dependent epimerase/dehydratase [Magnetococcus marinus MC-1]
MKTVMVTGGAGYVGSILLRRLLERNYRVVCVDNLMFGGEALLDIWEHPHFSLAKRDIRDREAMQALFAQTQFHGVIHLAAIVGDPACARQSELAQQTNWQASIDLLEASKQHGVERFIFASTCSNYGKMADPGGFVTETSTLAPVSLYAELKVKFEKTLLESDPSPDFCPTALRFATVYGISHRMRFDLTVNEFTKELALDKELVVFGEQFWRPYCHVADFSRAMLAVLEAPREKVAYDVFNVGDTAENYTKGMILNELLKVYPNARIKRIEKKEDPRDYRVNFSKIAQRLDFKISKTVPMGMQEIAEILQLGVIPNPEEQKFYNIPHTP